MIYIPNTDQDKKDMLDLIGISSQELFADIPQRLQIDNINIPRSFSEIELKRHLKGLSKKAKKTSLFIGAGSYNHFIPSVVNHVISRSEFYTAYTPYQPEISQGILQAMYEYQTMICDLTGMEVSNASMYDGASSLAESALMACSITKKRKILVSKAIHPNYREVLKTYCKFNQITYEELELKDGVTETKQPDRKTAAILVQNPNFFGCIENIEELRPKAKDTLLIACIVEPTSLGILKPPKEADIVCGEAQSFGNPLNFGGPYLGILATKEKYMRKLPGRIAGKTVDAENNPGFILTLQAREQHIRRDKATSNICSNQALNALAACVYLSTLGKSGVRKVGELCYHKAHYLQKKLAEIGKAEFTSPFYNEFVIRFDKDITPILEENNILAYNLEKDYPELKNCILFCATEMNTKEEIDLLIDIIKDGTDIR